MKIWITETGFCTFQKYGDQRQLQSFVVSILPLGSSTVCVCSWWKFIFSCPAVGCTAWVAGGGGVVFCTSQLCRNCGNIVRKHDMCYQFLGWRFATLFVVWLEPTWSYTDAVPWTRRMRPFFEEDKKKLGTLHPDKYDSVSSRNRGCGTLKNIISVLHNINKWFIVIVAGDFEINPPWFWITDQSVTISERRRIGNLENRKYWIIGCYRNILFSLRRRHWDLFAVVSKPKKKTVKDRLVEG